MVKCQVVMDALERIAPHHLAEDWDNPGLLVGSPDRQVSRILVALDVSDTVVRQAVHEGAEMIVAHHPLLFKPIKKIRTDEPLGHRLQVLLQHDIAVAAAHTNLDIARGGVNDVLAEAIGLSKLSSFVITQQEESGQTESLGRIGTLPQPMAIRDFAEQVRKALPTEHVRFVDAGSRPVRKVALCSGAGAEFIAKPPRWGPMLMSRAMCATTMRSTRRSSACMSSTPATSARNSPLSLRLRSACARSCAARDTSRSWPTASRRTSSRWPDPLTVALHLCAQARKDIL